MLKKWIEAMRLRTLPVSIAGVIAGTGCAVWHGKFNTLPALLCLLFAVLAQIASNFGNEYYDFANGIDKKGREGFRRGVTEGDISPRAMKAATFGVLVAAALTGCTLLLFGGWWLIIAGIAILLFALAYSTGPYPLSHHGLGDVAVIIFFGIVPVNLTCYLQCGGWNGIETSMPVSVAVGLLAANVLILNNYRDADDDKKVGKNTTVVIFGRKTMSLAYLVSGIMAVSLTTGVWFSMPFYTWAVPLACLGIHILLWIKLGKSHGSAINPLLGKTALNLLLFSLLMLVAITLFR